MEELRQEGNELFKGGDYEGALAIYTRALELHPTPQEQAVLHRNRAACHLKLEEYDKAESEASKGKGQAGPLSPGACKAGVDSDTPPPAFSSLPTSRAFSSLQLPSPLVLPIFFPLGSLPGVLLTDLLFVPSH